MKDLLHIDFYKLVFWEREIFISKICLFAALIFILAFCLTRCLHSNLKVIPNPFQSAIEIFYDLVFSLAIENIGEENGENFVGFLFSLFFFLLVANLLGSLPFSYPINGQIIVTAVFSVIVFSVCVLGGLYFKGLGFFHVFLPEGVPVILAPFIIIIEVINFFAKYCALCLRLCVSVAAGHLVIEIFSKFVETALTLFMPLSIIPLLTLSCILLMELFVGILQAYIFTLLSSVYIGQILNEH